MSAVPERPAPLGEALPHESASGHVTGRALYTDDLIDRFPGLLHAWPVQAPHAHARVLDLRTDEAERVPGVVAVLTAADAPGLADAGVAGDEPLFPEEVMFHGQAVCWVLGEDLESARLGAESVQVTYSPLPALVTLAEAIAADSFQGAQPVLARGDVTSALGSAAQVVQGETECGGQEHFALETQASLAHVDEAGQVFVHCSTQHPSETQTIVAQVLGLPLHAVTVQCLRMGGGFGGKEMQPHGYAAVAALGAVRTGRPVRLRLPRALDMVLTGKRHPVHARWEAGFDPQGRLLALRAVVTTDGGWSMDLSQPVLTRLLCHVDNAYHLPHVEVRGRIARTHKTSQTAFRGFGGPQGMLLIEDILGRSAPLLGLDPAELRRRNLYRPGERTPYGQEVRHAERLTRVWEEVSARAELETRRAEIAAANARSPHTKRGIALTPVKFGISFNRVAFNQAGALVHVYQDGSVLLSHGGTEMGQGLHTKMRQVAAAELGVPLDLVRHAPTRTDTVPNTSATAASSGTDLNGAAVRRACARVREQLASVASEQLGGKPEQLRFRDGRVRGPAGRSVPFQEVVRDAYRARVPLSATGFHRTEGIHWDDAAMQGEPFKYFAVGAAVSEVEVDGFTGAHRLLRTDIVHDVGDSLNPLVDRGQIEGGFLQGVGWLTLEDLRWDTSDGPGRGRLLTRGASTYKLPSLGEAPPRLSVHLLGQATEERAIHGAKAVGEPPLMLALSVREALREAIAAFGGGEVPVTLPSPATPEAVFWALEAVRERRWTG